MTVSNALKRYTGEELRKNIHEEEHFLITISAANDLIRSLNRYNLHLHESGTVGHLVPNYRCIEVLCRVILRGGVTEGFETPFFSERTRKAWATWMRNHSNHCKIEGVRDCIRQLKLISDLHI